MLALVCPAHGPWVSNGNGTATTRLVERGSFWYVLEIDGAGPVAVAGAGAGTGTGPGAQSGAPRFLLGWLSLNESVL